MGPSIESTNTRRRNSENDGQILLGGGSIGITVRSRNVGSSKRMEGMLEGFHNRCARQMTRQFIQSDPENEGEWITPPVAATLAGGRLTATDDLC
jgi:hypothetical protein